MGLTYFPNGILATPNIGLTPHGSAFGNTHFVNSGHANANDSNPGTREEPLNTIQQAVTNASSNDTIIIAPGEYTENVVTGDDTGARNVTIIGSGGATIPGWNAGVGWAPTTTSSPCLQIKASGWRVMGICFKPGATSSGIEFLGNQSTANFLAGAAGSLCRGGWVENCLFWGNSTGKYGIVLQGVTGTQAPHHIHIINNRFIYLAATSGYGIYVAASGNPVYGCAIIGNTFESNTNHIGTASGIGYVGCRIERNSLPIGGTYKHVTTSLLDLRATATPAVTGGNAVINNYFGCTAAQFADDDATDWVHANGYDQGMGNWCSDGIQAANISNSSM